MRKMYVDAEEVSKDWGVSKPKAYKMIKELNERMLKDNSNLIVIAGKVNRKFYEENCYGQTKEVQEVMMCQPARIKKEVHGKSI